MNTNESKNEQPPKLDFLVKNNSEMKMHQSTINNNNLSSHQIKDEVKDDFVNFDNLDIVL